MPDYSISPTNYGQVNEALNNKLDTDFGNPTGGGVETSVSWGMPDWDSGISITTTNQEAPNNGWLIGRLTFSGNNMYASAYINDRGIAQSPWSNGSNWGTLSLCVPIKKGQFYRYFCNGTVQQNGICFYPIEGK